MNEQSCTELAAIKKLSHCHQNAVKEIKANVHVYGNKGTLCCSIDNVIFESIVHQQTPKSSEDRDGKVEHLCPFSAPSNLSTSPRALNFSENEIMHTVKLNRNVYIGNSCDSDDGKYK